MTMVPRTGPLSAISARAITSWYQRGKSSARDTIAPLLMGAQVTGVRTGPRRTAARRLPAGAGMLDPAIGTQSMGDSVGVTGSVGGGGPAVNRLDLRRGVVRVHPRRF